MKSYLMLVLLAIFILFAGLSNAQDMSSVNSIVARGGIIYAGTSGEGIFASSDNGLNWVSKNDGLTDKHINVLVSDSSNLYAGTEGGGIFLLKEGSNKWISLGSLENAIISLAVKKDFIWAGTSDGVYRSSLITVNWEYAWLKNNKVYSLLLNNEKVYAGTESGLYVSSSSEISWSKIPLDTRKVKDIDVPWLGMNGTRILAEVKDYGIYFLNNDILCLLAGYDFTASSIAINEDNIFAGTKDGQVMKFSNKYIDTSWKSMFNTYENITSLLLTGEYLYAGTKNGKIFSTKDNGITWKPVTKADKMYVVNNKVKYRPGFKTYVSEFWWGCLDELAYGGTAIGVFAILASFLYAHHKGESDLISIDPAVFATIFYVLGSMTGSVMGVKNQGEELDGTGSFTLAFIGGILGEAGSIFWLVESQKGGNAGRVAAVTSLFISPPLLATIGYNLHHKKIVSGGANSSLFYIKHGKCSFNIPKFFLTQDIRTKEIITNVNLFHISF